MPNEWITVNSEEYNFTPTPMFDTIAAPIKCWIDLSDGIVKTEPIKTPSFEEVASEELKDKFKRVLSYSQNYPYVRLNVDNLFANWFHAKKRFFKMFDNQLIVNCGEVQFQLDQETKDSRFWSFINSFFSQYGNLCHPDFLNFLETQQDGFFDNKIVYNYYTPTGDLLPCGMKLLKATKYFVEDSAIVDIFQTGASMVIQETCLTGELCFSIHPLDYLSVSENQHNWRSCHALDGEYRSGNLNYMVDSSTIVCYVKSKEDTILPRFPEDVPWNNKKWRVLLFLSDDGYSMMAGRQYPFFNREALDLLLEKMQYNLNGFGKDWFSWHDDKIQTFNYENKETAYMKTTFVPIQRGIYDIYKLIENGPNTHHFNDLLSSSCYSPYYVSRDLPYVSRDPHFSIGAEAPCILCGEVPIGVSDDMLCLDCELEYGHSNDEDLFGTCALCDERVLTDDMVEVLDGGEWIWICPDCRDADFWRCDCCNTYKRRKYMIEDGLCKRCSKEET